MSIYSKFLKFLGKSVILYSSIIVNMVKHCGHSRDREIISIIWFCPIPFWKERTDFQKYGFSFLFPYRFILLSELKGFFAFTLSLDNTIRKKNWRSKQKTSPMFHLLCVNNQQWTPVHCSNLFPILHGRSYLFFPSPGTPVVLPVIKLVPRSI